MPDDERPAAIIRPKAYTEIELPTPPMGGKIWLLNKKGLFVLERGPGTLRTIACTHAGEGVLVAIDGVPDDGGFFPGAPFGNELPTDPNEVSYNGRPFYRANPIVMGSWMLDGGFEYGLTIHVDGGSQTTLAMASIVWMPARRK